jgi:hypothetical protein
MIKVIALDTFKKNNLKAKELDRIPNEGELFEVSEERLQILLGDNSYKKVFVKVVEEPKAEKPKKKIEEAAILEDLEDNVERAVL